MSSDVIVRMYDVGFGDCFLVVVPGDPPRTILVDAGFHAHGKGAFSGKGLAVRVIEDVTKISGRARIDVVVATHRHQDHVYSFNAPEWDEVEVGEVWMPWVEDRQNPEAVKLWKKREELAARLAAALPSFGLDKDTRADVDFLLWNAGEGAPMFPGWSNRGALDRLHEGFAARDREEPRFLPETDLSPESFTTAVLPGVTVHVLGPPRDAARLTEGDPERDGETYRALALTEADHAGRAVDAPFSAAWKAPRDAKGGLKQDEVQRLRGLARAVDPVFAAQALDGMINATSLVLVLQIGRAKLLLPGDAEWGTWKIILESERARALLRGTTFVKVGHHGSHNGTPKSLVEEVLKPGTKGMISTQEGPGTYRSRIPLPDLVSALRDHGVALVRSDAKKSRLPKGFSRDDQGDVVEVALPM